MDSPSAQLSLDIRSAVSRNLTPRRPILHHLNADTSWLLQVPRPPAAARRGRQYYNILIDPWFKGRQTDIASWFSHQEHVERSSVQSIAQVEELLREIEILSTDLRLGKGRLKNGYETGSDTSSFIDVVAVSHEFTDHCHEDTLLEVHPDVPVVAAPKAAEMIRSWSHFRTVLDTPIFSVSSGSSDWRATSIPPLPEWLGISRIVSPNELVILHAALLITFSASVCSPAPCSPIQAPTNGQSTNHNIPNEHIIPPNDTSQDDDDDDQDAAEAIIYTPHGIPFPALSFLPSARPPIRPLAFLHGLHDVTVNALLQHINLGAHNGLAAQRILNARYWFPTHDEVKDGGGIVRWLLRRKQISLEDAVREEMRREGKGEMSGEGVERAVRETGFGEMRNGESRVLY